MSCINEGTSSVSYDSEYLDDVITVKCNIFVPKYILQNLPANPVYLDDAITVKRNVFVHKFILQNLMDKSQFLRSYLFFRCSISAQRLVKTNGH